LSSLGFFFGLVGDAIYLAVWVREHGGWKFVAYQPTPIIDG